MCAFVSGGGEEILLFIEDYQQDILESRSFWVHCTEQCFLYFVFEETKLSYSEASD